MIDKNVYARELILAIKNANKELINKVRVFDVYEGKNIPPGKKSIALSVEIQPVVKTLNEKEIEDITSNIIKNAFEKLDAEIRKI